MKEAERLVADRAQALAAQARRADERQLALFDELARTGDPVVLAVCNFTPVPRRDYRIGVPHGGVWREALNSDAADYGGSGIGNRDSRWTVAKFPFSPSP